MLSAPYPSGYRSNSWLATAESGQGILRFRRQCCIVRARAVANDLPSKEGAHLSKGVRFGVAKHDDVLGIEEHDEVIAVALKLYQPFRTIEVGGHCMTMFFGLRNSESVMKWQKFRRSSTLRTCSNETQLN